jgi:dual specificity phosphatase 12
MGKSRAATCVAAYLMHKYKISPSDAISQIRESRPLAEPNDGFMRQLELYHQMNMPVDVNASPIYQRWLFQRELRLSNECGQAPDADKIRFEDEHVDAKGEAAPAEKELRCKKCRYDSEIVHVVNSC